MTSKNISISAIAFSMVVIGLTGFLLVMSYPTTFTHEHENKQTIPVADVIECIIYDEGIDISEYVIYDEGIDISDRIVTFDFDQPTQVILHGEPRMVTPQAIIDFSGDKVTYSGDLPVDEAAKVFFEAVMGFVREARECKNESK